jgi:lysophospholipase L1-like esterase
MKIAAILFLLSCTMAMAQAPPDPVYAPITEQPGLPRVLIIGDSISVGYTLPVRKLLAGEANVLRIPTNAGTSGNGVFQMDAWLGKQKWDVVHFNFGLHDLKRLSDGEPQVPIAMYERYLRLFVKRLKATGAKLIWATTTPVPEGPVAPTRKPEDVGAYNAAALRVMKENGITIDDLYAFALPRLKEIQQPVNVHFTNAGSEALAAQVAASIRKALRLR